MCKLHLLSKSQRVNSPTLYLDEDTVRHWSPHFPHSQEILNVRTAHTPQSLAFAVSSMACAEDILFMGGSKGEYAYRRLDDKDEPVHYGTTTDHSNGIANHINVTQARNGGTCIHTHMSWI